MGIESQRAAGEIESIAKKPYMQNGRPPHETKARFPGDPGQAGAPDLCAFMHLPAIRFGANGVLMAGAVRGPQQQFALVGVNVHINHDLAIAPNEQLRGRLRP